MATADEAPQALRLARPPRPSHSRQRLLSASLELVRHRHYRLPRPLLHTVSVAAQCCDSGLCRAVCPTGALCRESTDAGMQVLFSALRCIGCGACAQACPEKAFRIDACPDESWQRTRVVVSHRERECPRCGSRFTALDDHPLCDACSKSQALAQDLFRHIFAGDRPTAMTEATGTARGSD